MRAVEKAGGRTEPVAGPEGGEKGVDRVTPVAISPDGKLLASGSEGIKLWSLPEGKQMESLSVYPTSVNAVAISPDGKLLAAGCGCCIVLLELSGLKRRWVLFDPEVEQNQVRNGSVANTEIDHLRMRESGIDGRRVRF